MLIKTVKYNYASKILANVFLAREAFIEVNLFSFFFFRGVVFQDMQQIREGKVSTKRISTENKKDNN